MVSLEQIDFLLLFSAFFFLIIGSVYDLKTRKIPNSVPIAFLSVAVILRTIGAVSIANKIYFTLPLVIGFGMFLIGFFLFSVKIWGGGDVKMMTVLAFAIGIISEHPWYFFGVYVAYLIGITQCVKLIEGFIKKDFKIKRSFIPYALVWLVICITFYAL